MDLIFVGLDGNKQYLLNWSELPPELFNSLKKNKYLLENTFWDSNSRVLNSIKKYESQDKEVPKYDIIKL